MRAPRMYIMLLTLSLTFCVKAQELTEVIPDSIGSVESTSEEKHRSIITRVIDYFKESNKPKEYKKFDFSIIGGPHYSSDTQFGIGMVAAGLYRTDLNDTITPVSNVSLYGDLSTVGFYEIGVRGNHIFHHDDRRIDYNLYFYSFPRKFWGIGYDMGKNMSNESKFDEFYVFASVDYLMRLHRGLYVGPALEFAYANASDMERPELWEGQASHTATFGVGFRLQYDTRDNLTAPESGMLAAVEQRFCPKFLSNRYAFSYTDAKLNYYQKVWRGGVVAGQYHARFNYGNTPWASLASFGGSNTMRGYYDGRFRDKCEMDLTIELRQHVWRRNGIVVWGGLGTVFPNFSKFHFHTILPNGGVGYRWEFKQRTNVRLDFGIGKGETAFIFSINEAF